METQVAVRPKRKYVKKLHKPHKQIIPKEPKARVFVVTFTIC